MRNWRVLYELESANLEDFEAKLKKTFNAETAWKAVINAVRSYHPDGVFRVPFRPILIVFPVPPKNRGSLGPCCEVGDHNRRENAGLFS
ncbi:hypothetical protein L596_023731 [Steinernema carpocapsae]|uniref:Uncharacterized protein n=1 Tax=Steinernema carpocapsae TaxID=34508 RepID=A0A4V5ZZH5_STECR|nr:hypothetical protein L596_023731 [Steinernema carpocapsae]